MNRCLEQSGCCSRTMPWRRLPYVDNKHFSRQSDRKISPNICATGRRTSAFEWKARPCSLTKCQNLQTSVGRVRWVFMANSARRLWVIAYVQTQIMGCVPPIGGGSGVDRGGRPRIFPICSALTQQPIKPVWLRSHGAKHRGNAKTSQKVRHQL